MNKFTAITTAALLLTSIGTARADEIGLTTSKAVGEQIEFALNADLVVTLTWGNGETETYTSTGTPKTLTLKDQSLTITTEEEITRFYAPSAGLTALDVSKATKLTKLIVPENELTALSLTKNTALLELDCQGNALTELTTSNARTIQVINCANNDIAKMTYSTMASTQVLVCSNNELDTLRFQSSMAKMQSLWCDNNKLRTLNLSKSTALQTLVAANNDLYLLQIPAAAAELTDVWLAHNELDVTDLAEAYEFFAVLPRIAIPKILGYYYRIRTPNYRFNGEKHDFFELTYVDTGELETEVDGKLYTLKEKDLMIYGPGQFHTQYTDAEHSASYITVLFNMRNLTPVDKTVWYEGLISRVFHYDQKINTLLKAFVRESTTGVPYMNSLMLCLLTETIIRLLQGTYASPTAQPASASHQSAMDELLERILAYIDQHIYEPLTIPELCEHFSLSRSALQLLFKNSVDQSPKKYINDKKLERSCQLLLENRYTISEISLRLGYSSIHYFSKSFNMKYHMSPSEFVKQNCAK